MTKSKKVRESDRKEPDTPGPQKPVVEHFAAQYLGPLPLPSHMREYEEILPGSAERILAMAERQSKHRQDIEKVVIRGDNARAWVGVSLGASLALCCIGGGIALSFFGQPAAGTSIATVSVASLAGVFVYGTHSRRVERSAPSPAIKNK